MWVNFGIVFISMMGSVENISDKKGVVKLFDQVKYVENCLSALFMRTTLNIFFHILDYYFGFRSHNSN